MRLNKTIIIFAGLLSFISCDSKPNTAAYSMANIEQTDGKVYICTGANAKKYHRSRTCKGLDNCKKKVQKVTIPYAEAKGRTPCKICYKKK